MCIIFIKRSKQYVKIKNWGGKEKQINISEIDMLEIFKISIAFIK